MIDNEQLGIKVAENRDEAFWNDTKEQCEKAIEIDKRNILISEKILELAKSKLKK